MCYQGCRYEVGWGDGAGECGLPSGKIPPIDAMCSINELQAENEELRDENARLRSCLSDDAENARMIMAENRKLRELVRNLVYATHPIDRADLIKNAVELGIEVDA